MTLLAVFVGLALAALVSELLYRNFLGTRFKQELQNAKTGLREFSEAQGDSQRQTAAIRGGINLLRVSAWAMFNLVVVAVMVAAPAVTFLATTSARLIYTVSFTLCSIAWVMVRRKR